MFLGVVMLHGQLCLLCADLGHNINVVLILKCFVITFAFVFSITVRVSLTSTQVEQAPCSWMTLFIGITVIEPAARNSTWNEKQIDQLSVLQIPSCFGFVLIWLP